MHKRFALSAEPPLEYIQKSEHESGDESWKNKHQGNHARAFRRSSYYYNKYSRASSPAVGAPKSPADAFIRIYGRIISAPRKIRVSLRRSFYTVTAVGGVAFSCRIKPTRVLSRPGFALMYRSGFRRAFTSPPLSNGEKFFISAIDKRDCTASGRC
ncbi:hypothetical protein EVAR_8859_1 [Eumeta japonica]|uniref:Uncharacterized protein n=1 Tax=Eumeta variegata TaxID=151549 RepID=A0A4C1TU18_EUMVA|nr:hypothetical protein EVAR_8859_1 [Eumeta japonica]